MGARYSFDPNPGTGITWAEAPDLADALIGVSLAFDRGGKTPSLPVVIPLNLSHQPRIKGAARPAHLYFGNVMREILFEGEVSPWFPRGPQGVTRLNNERVAERFGFSAGSAVGGVHSEIAFVVTPENRDPALCIRLGKLHGWLGLGLGRHSQGESQQATDNSRASYDRFYTKAIFRWHFPYQAF